MLSIIILAGVSIILGTALRVSLLAIYPFLVLLIAAAFRFRVTYSLVLMVILICVSLSLSFFHHPFLKYKLVALFYMLPFIFLLFSKPDKHTNQRADYLAIYIKCLTFVAVINNIIGFIQVMRNPVSDDSFMGLYSNFSVSQNGLVLLNTLLSVYYLISYVNNKQRLHLAATIFFFISGVLGYYGAGLIICLVAMVLCFFRISLHRLFKTIFVSVLGFGILYLLILFLKPSIISYNVANIRKIAEFNVVEGPRKLTSFYNYAISYPRDLKDFLFGSGPGTFNSRSAFMVGSPSYFTGLPFIKDETKPYYFENFAYTLWNESNTSQSQYLDGFRNQPFSSLLAFLGEYGLIFTLMLSFLYYRYYHDVAREYRENKWNSGVEIYFRYFKFLIVLLPLLLLIDNYHEYPEIMLLILLGIKFAHAGIGQQHGPAIKDEPDQR